MPCSATALFTQVSDSVVEVPKSPLHNVCSLHIDHGPTVAHDIIYMKFVSGLQVIYINFALDNVDLPYTH
jgi:hypothetical protein